ncbi:MAG TPA: Rieske 2Fe-2S domain-containing protein [Chloroflexota bacterium]|nr:Rieske 2Fe-2S domain-containing protein [Chloroflexota bacterium]
MTPEENELLTRVGPGTPMGNLFRQFWFPVVPSADAPAAGEHAIRIRLLGEDLVMFRDTAGRIGLLGEHCSHRCASLYFGRNEDGGLRCIYHGWLYGVDGRCLEIPNEAVAESMRQHIRHPAYPCREVNGTIWTYMGPRRGDELPPLPEFGLATIPENQKRMSLTVRECNYLQSLEGDLDLSHGAYLHSFTARDLLIGAENHIDRYTNEKPTMDARDTPYGVVHCVRRRYDEEQYHYGVGHFFFPFMTMFPPVSDWITTVSGHIWVPIDDYSTLVWFYSWHPSKPVGDPEWRSFAPRGTAIQSPSGQRIGRADYWEERLPPGTAAGDAWRQRAQLGNDFGYDPEVQLRGRYSGLPSTDLEDRAMQEGMGRIVNRAREHLGPTDVAEMRVRMRLLEAARALRDRGEVPACVDEPSAFRFRCASGLLPKDVPWLEGTREWTIELPDNPVRSKGHARPAFLEPEVAQART